MQHSIVIQVMKELEKLGFRSWEVEWLLKNHSLESLIESFHLRIDED